MNDTTTSKNEYNKFGTEDPPEPDLETEKETSEIPRHQLRMLKFQLTKKQLLYYQIIKMGMKLKKILS